MAGSESDIRITTGTPYLALTGELWGVYCEDFGENRPRYNGTALYVVLIISFMITNDHSTTTVVIGSRVPDLWHRRPELMGGKIILSLRVSPHTAYIGGAYSTPWGHRKHFRELKCCLWTPNRTFKSCKMLQAVRQTDLGTMIFVVPDWLFTQPLETGAGLPQTFDY